MTWAPDPAAFLADLEAKPEALRALASAIDGDPWPVDASRVRRVVLFGMGSSRSAALVAASRLRARGIDAWAEYASAEAVHPGGPGTLAVAISASGNTEETVAAFRRHAEAGSTTVALTNVAGSPLTGVGEAHLEMLAGPEAGGVACRSFQHTVLRLLQLEGHLGEAGPDVRRLALAAADASEDLLSRRDAWLPGATEMATGADGTFLIAPNERISSAEQGALMLREGPRRRADACESGDWLHVDVYLTKSLDYRAIVFAGSRFDEVIMTWMGERGARVLAVGADVAGAAAHVRFPGDGGPDVALVSEILVPELVAAALWRRA